MKSEKVRYEFKGVYKNENGISKIEVYKKMGNDKVDVLIATPPCQGMSVANHKKQPNEIDRNSLVVESVNMIVDIKPRFFIIEKLEIF